MVNTRMTFTFKHPKFYRIPRDKKDQAISSCSNSTELAQRAPGPGLKQQAIDETVPYNDIEEAEASSHKPQAPSSDKNK